ncbi:MAG TPA: single-stranded DNA-binding protein [Candidatus Tectomicrobia bacterium]
MASFNKVILLGNLTRDPELRYTPNGTPVATFGMATNRRSGQGDERREDVCFVDIVVFGREAETASEFLSKGRAALIEGRLQWRSWEQDGQKRSKHEVVAERIQFMPRGREEGMERTPPETGMERTPPRAGMERTPPAPPRAREETDFAPPLEDDDIPF